MRCVHQLPSGPLPAVFSLEAAITVGPDAWHEVHCVGKGWVPSKHFRVFPMGSGWEALGHTPWRGVSAQLRDCTTRMLGAAQTNPRMPPAPLDSQSSSRSGRRAHNYSFPFSHAALIPAFYQLPRQASKGDLTIAEPA